MSKDQTTETTVFITAKRSPEEVRSEMEGVEFHLRNIHKHDMRRPGWQGYVDALKWVLREEG